jgi:hypothetical protein
VITAVMILSGHDFVFDGVKMPRRGFYRPGNGRLVSPGQHVSIKLFRAHDSQATQYQA